MTIIVCLNRVRTLPDEEKRVNIIDRKKKALLLSNEEKFLVEKGFELAEKTGDSDVIVLAAGLSKDSLMLREALAMGCLKARLHAYDNRKRLEPGEVPYRMAIAVRSVLRERKDVLLITGERTMDGLYGFLGPQLAAFLSFPLISAIENMDADICGITGFKTSGGCKYQIKARIPAVVSLVNAKAKGKAVSVTGIQKAFEKELHVVNVTHSEKTDGYSPLIRTIYRNYSEKNCEMHDEITVEEAADVVINKLKERRLL